MCVVTLLSDLIQLAQHRLLVSIFLEILRRIVPCL